jgi:hypothetical protein
MTVDRRAADALYRVSYGAFAYAAYAELNPNAPLIPNWHIDCICHHLQAMGRIIGAFALSIRILPGRPRGDRAIANPHRPDSPYEDVPVSAIVVAHQIDRCSIPRECLDDLLRQSLRRRVPRHREPKQLSPAMTDDEKQK